MFLLPSLSKDLSRRRNTNAEQPLLELQSEEFAVRNTQCCTSGTAEIRREQRLRVVPSSGTSFKLSNIVIVGTFCKRYLLL